MTMVVAGAVPRRAWAEEDSDADRHETEGDCRVRRRPACVDAHQERQPELQLLQPRTVRRRRAYTLVFSSHVASCQYVDQPLRCSLIR